MDRFLAPTPQKDSPPDESSPNNTSVESTNNPPDGWNHDDEDSDEAVDSPETPSVSPDKVVATPPSPPDSPTPSEDRELLETELNGPTDDTPSRSDKNVSFGDIDMRTIPARPDKSDKQPNKSNNKNSKKKKPNNKKKNPNPPAPIRPQRPAPAAQRSLTETRFQVVFNVTRNESTEEFLHKMAEELYRELLDIDQTIKILPWWPDDDENPELNGIDQLPGNPFKLRKYFDRFYPPRFAEKERTKGVWTAVHLGHSTPAEKIRLSMIHWRHDFRVKALQCPKTSVVGWALYSTRNMDPKALQQLFLTEHKLTVSCRWRAITLGTMTLDNKDRPKALHFEVDASEHPRAKRILFGIYRKEVRKTKHFPMGYRMRMVPELSQASSTQAPDVQKMILRQQHFASMINSYSYPWGGHDIDIKPSAVGMSLRTVLTYAVDPNDANNPTFLSIKSERGSLMVDYLKINENRAHEILRGLVPYTKFQLAGAHEILEDTEEYDELMGHIETMFPPSLVAANEDMKWCPASDSVITIFDQYLQDITDDCDLFDFSGMETEPLRNSSKPSLTAGEERILNLYQGRSTDSVGTFASRISSIPPRSESGAESESDDDDISWGTMQSHIQTSVQENLEKHLDKRIGDMQRSLLTAMQDMMLKNGFPSTVQTSISTESTTTLTNSQARNDSDFAMPQPSGKVDAGQDT